MFVNTLSVNPQTVAMQRVHSSFIAAIGYDLTARTAVVEFKSGSTYAYANVHPKTMRKWVNAPSLGRFFHQKVRNHYDYQRIAA